ncbi:MAG: DUF2961 domain-containing protein [Candidatus Sumerlaeota bacterium]|nr:DUF2961 domain-containing protein [Candidatus Sumerlaeota bacterium]
MNSPLDSLARLRAGRTKRISSYNRDGGNADKITIAPGEVVTIAKMRGPGCIRHIWFTVAHQDPMYRRNMILRMYWDGSKNPSVECPVGDFFGQGWGEEYLFAALPLAASPKAGKALNSYFPMPFAGGAQITVENDSEKPCGALYYYVDYEEYDKAQPDLGRFHAFWSRSRNEPTEGHENEWRLFTEFAKNLTDKFNHPIVDAEGRGHFVGVNYYVDSPTPLWYGEGDDMYFIDGEPWPPSLHGTGTEDYFNSSWCPKEIYIHPYFGYPRVNEQTGHLGRTHCYRFHIEDPIIFHKSLRGNIERGHADSLTTDIVTVAYWYQTLPHKPFPALPNRAGRQNMPPIGPREIHRWREAWRQLQGGGNLWGHEPLPKAFLEKLEKKASKGRKALAPAKNRAIAEAEMMKQEEMLNRRKGRK